MIKLLERHRRDFQFHLMKNWRKTRGQLLPRALFLFEALSILLEHQLLANFTSNCLRWKKEMISHTPDKNGGGGGGVTVVWCKRKPIKEEIKAKVIIVIIFDGTSLMIIGSLWSLWYYYVLCCCYLEVSMVINIIKWVFREILTRFFVLYGKAVVEGVGLGNWTFEPR